MSWKDKLRDASFRGVSFFVEDAGYEGGRRLVPHEFPFRDKPYIEDMGRKARSFPIEAYVVGDDYMDSRDKLIEALEKEGSGELVHPYIGTLQVSIESFSVRESSQEGRLARFSITVRESGEKYYPNEKTDIKATANTAADTLKKTAAADFAKKFNVSDYPEYVSTAVGRILNDIGINTEDLDLAVLMRSPETLAAKTQDIIDAITDINSLITLGNSGEYTSTTSKSTGRRAIVDNSNALLSLVHQTAAANAVLIAVETDYETRGEAEAVRSAVAGILDTEAEAVESSDSYLAITDMRAALVTALPVEELPDLIYIQLGHVTTSLALAYEVYGDAGRADEIAARNKARHPGFMGPDDVQLISEGAVLL